jgi:hypothetical protein
MRRVESDLTQDQLAAYHLASGVLVAIALIQVVLGWLGPRGAPRVLGPIILLALAWGLRCGRKFAACAVVALSLLIAPIGLLGAWQRGGAAAAVVAVSETAAPIVFLLLLVGDPDLPRRRRAMIVFAALIVLPSVVGLVITR